LFVLCVLYSKDKRQNQDKQVQIKYTEAKKSCRGHGYLSVVRVVCCQVEVSATGWSLVQRSPTDCGVSLCVISKPQAWGG
jgi:hypothetical protein